MLELDKRTAILMLAAQGHGKKTIAKLLKVSKNSVKKVLKSGVREVPIMERAETLLEHLPRIRELHLSCKGNTVRVHEELVAEGVAVAYSTLTAFCRRQGIGVKEKTRSGSYHFDPGQEMQHDTSPHTVKVGERDRKLQCASLVLCYSRKIFAQLYPRWTRFEARLFLCAAFTWLGGTADQCMLDNSTVIMLGGTGPDAYPAPEMKALADRFNFKFVAHNVGDADRSARVERPFDFIDNNFYAGRSFEDLADLNRQLKQWCEDQSSKYRRSLQASWTELFVAEAPHLNPLPVYIPEVYRLHSRKVDVGGYVNLHTNRYSVDASLIGLSVEVRETEDKVRIFRGHKLTEEHEKLEHGARRHQMLSKHQRQFRRQARIPSPHEPLLRAQGPEFEKLIDALRKRHGGSAVRAQRTLHRIWTDYPSEAVAKAISEALDFGLTDLKRIEKMVLQQIAGDYFRLPKSEDETDD